MDLQGPFFLSNRIMVHLVWVFFILLVSGYVAQPIKDPDLWWHIVVGRWISAHGELPTVDHWTMFANGNKWYAYSWLPEIFFSKVDQYFGNTGLVLFQMLAILAFTLCVSYFIGKHAKDHFLGACIGAVVVAGCSYHTSLRPQLFSWIFFAAVIGILFDEEKTFKKKSLLLFLIGVLWGNTHFSSIYGILAIALLSINQKPSLANPALANHCILWPDRKTLYFIPIFFLGTIFTPYFGQEWLVALETSTHPFSFTSILEFQPAHLQQYSSAVALLLLVWSLALAGSEKLFPVISVGQYLLLAITGLGGAMVIKFLPYFFITLGFFTASLWRYSDSTGPISIGIQKLKTLIVKLPKEGLAFLFFALIFGYVSNLVKHPVDYTDVPKTSLDYIISKNLPRPLLNSFGDGGYVMYRFADKNGDPTRLVSLDGRTNLIDSTLQSEFSSALAGDRNWDALLKRVDANTVLWNKVYPLTTLLLTTKEWCIAFEDKRGSSAVLVRKITGAECSNF